MSRGLKAMGREVAFQLRLASRDPMPTVFTVAFPLMGMFLIQYLHRGVTTPDPGIDIALAVAQYQNQDFSNWGPFAPYGTAAGVALALSIVCIAHPAIALATAREHGMLRHVRTTPIPAWAYIAAQVATVTLFSISAAALTMGVGVWLFGVRIFAYQIAPLALVVIIASLSFAVLGIAWSNAIVRVTTAHTQVYLALFPVLLMSSVLTAPQLLIADMRAIGEWLPLKPIIDALYLILATDAALPAPEQLARLLMWTVPAAVFAFPAFRWLPAENADW